MWHKQIGASWDGSGWVVRPNIRPLGRVFRSQHWWTGLCALVWGLGIKAGQKVLSSGPLMMCNCQQGQGNPQATCGILGLGASVTILLSCNCKEQRYWPAEDAHTTHASALVGGTLCAWYSSWCLGNVLALKVVAHDHSYLSPEGLRVHASLVPQPQSQWAPGNYTSIGVGL